MSRRRGRNALDGRDVALQRLYGNAIIFDNANLNNQHPIPKRIESKIPFHRHGV